MRGGRFDAKLFFMGALFERVTVTSEGHTVAEVRRIRREADFDRLPEVVRATKGPETGPCWRCGAARGLRDHNTALLDLYPGRCVCVACMGEQEACSKDTVGLLLSALGGEGTDSDGFRLDVQELTDLELRSAVIVHLVEREYDMKEMAQWSFQDPEICAQFHQSSEEARDRLDSPDALEYRRP